MKVTEFEELHAQYLNKLLELIDTISKIDETELPQCATEMRDLLMTMGELAKRASS